MEFLRVLPLLTIAFACIAQAQTTYQGTEVQSSLEAAVSSGATSYTLPPGRINLTTSLRVKGGTKNFTLMGQTGTRLVRNSTIDFPLIIVGTPGKHAYENTAFEGAATTLSPVAEGAVSVTRTAGQSIVKGWYAIIGTHSTNDIVRTSDGVSTFYFKRELVRVTAVNGNVATLDGPVGRSFDNAELRLVEPDDLPQTVLPQVCHRVTLRNLVLDGASTIDGTKTTKVMVVGLSSGVFIDDISVSNFSTSGISVQVSKGVTINRARISQGNTTTMGYGVEFGGSRFVTVRNSTFATTRTGVLFQNGTMDGLIEDCSGATVNFDGGHGQGEKRLTYRRVLGNTFTIANTAWRRGVDSVTMEDCTAATSIAIHGGASNILIRGRYPGQTVTSPHIYTTTTTGGSGIPSGNHYVQSLTMENGATISTPTSSYNFQVATAPDGTCMLGTLVIRNWTFRSLFQTTSNLYFMKASNTPSISITNCSFEKIYEYSAPIYFGASPGNRWNLELRNNAFNVPGQHVAQFHTGATASWVNENNVINGQPVTLAHIINPGAIQ